MNALRRIGDIISSNVHSVLDKAEDPEKMTDLAIRRLEEAGKDLEKTIREKTAEKEDLERQISRESAAIVRWEDRARLAVRNGRDDLAREAIAEKIGMERMKDGDEKAAAALDAVITSLRSTEDNVGKRLKEMKAKSAELKARARGAKERLRANEAIRRSRDNDWAVRMDELDERIEKWEAEAWMADQEAAETNEFEAMERNEAIESELRKIREMQDA